jgi:hypothetical protein
VGSRGWGNQLRKQRALIRGRLWMEAADASRTPEPELSPYEASLHRAWRVCHRNAACLVHVRDLFPTLFPEEVEALSRAAMDLAMAVRGAITADRRETPFMSALFHRGELRPGAWPRGRAR